MHGASASSNEAIPEVKICEDLNIYTGGPMVLQGDNMVSLGMAQESRLTDGSKHTSIQYHFIRNVIQNGEIVVQYVSSEVQTSDILTQVLAGSLSEMHIAEW